MHGCTRADDGTFFIPFEQYLRQYAWTSIAVDNDPRYNRFNLYKQFKNDEHYAFFEFEIKDDAIFKAKDLE